MSSSANRSDPNIPTSFVMHGVTYRATATYRVQHGTTHTVTGSLVDGGANGGLAGDDVLILETATTAKANVIGITSEVMSECPIVQAAGLVHTLSGEPIICVFSQYAQAPRNGRSIHSKAQLQHFGCHVDDTSHRVGGKQCIVTPDGWTIPLHVREGLPYFDMSKPSPDDMSSSCHRIRMFS